MAAAYQVNVSATDDETFEFTCEWKMENGDPFPWDDYEIFYSLGGRSPHLVLNASNGGVFKDPTNDSVTFRAPAGQRLRPGSYEHGCRVTHIATMKTVQIFDGSVSITEGNF